MVFRRDPTFDVANIGEVDAYDYSSNIDPQKVLRDPRFLKDLRQYYEAKGSFISDDETLIEKF
jgi:hypothetical protein